MPAEQAAQLFAQLVAVHRGPVQDAEDRQLQHLAPLPDVAVTRLTGSRTISGRYIDSTGFRA
ncbi:hypothetical protein GCM10010452_39080 [Crossiella cryophila]